ncbi:MAG: YciI family protein [Myxococcota bacterium]
MQFMILMGDGDGAWEALSPAEQARVIEGHGEFRRALEAEGKFVSSSRLAPRAQAKTVRRSKDGRFDVIDGPFAESKEALGGFYVIEAKDVMEAVEWAKRVRFLSGANEVRPLFAG